MVIQLSARHDSEIIAYNREKSPEIPNTLNYLLYLCHGNRRTLLPFPMAMW